MCAKLEKLLDERLSDKTTRNESIFGGSWAGIKPFFTCFSNRQGSPKFS